MKPSPHGLHPAALAAVCAALILLFPAGASGADQQVLRGHVPPVISKLTPIGRLDGTNQLRLAIGLPLQHQQELRTLLQQIYDPASPNYRHYVTSAEFAQRFGPTVADYNAVADFAAKNHLTVTGTHPNRILLDVQGSVADIEAALHIKMLRYQHPKEQRTFYAPDTDPSVDLKVPLMRVGGLDDYIKPFPKSIREHSPKGGGKPKGGSGPGGAFMGNDYRDAYAPGVALTGRGQKVAIFELDGYFTSDILEYETDANIVPPVPLRNVLLDGLTGEPLSFGGNGEVSLDIENVAAMAPGLDEIIVYEGLSQDDVLNRIATDDAAAQISCSWGWGVPNPDAFEDQIYMQYAAQGQTFYDASGDVGTTLGANIVPPSDDPYIAQVGGTQLTTSGPFGSWVSETTWDEPDGSGGSTGGFSSVYPIPSWQLGISMTTNGGSTSFRNFPDMALTAENCFVVFEQGETGPFSGTSCAAPLWTAFTALINQQGALYGHPPVGFICPALYALAKGPRYDAVLHDITTGNNTNAVYTNQFFACVGYDLCTGWGTPTGSNLINALAPPAKVPALFVVTNVISGGNGNGVIDYDECNQLTITITNEGLAEATGIQGFLYSTTPGAIVAQSIVTFPDLPPGREDVSLPAFTLSTEPTFICGTPVDLVLVLKYEQGATTNTIEIPSGIVGTPDPFVNSTPFLIPTGNNTGIVSPVTVSGLQSAAKVTVSVYAQALYDEGLELQLISPNGTTVALTQIPDGGLGSDFGSGCGLSSETTFDDDAATSIEAGTAPFVGSFQPVQPLASLLPVYGTNLNGVWQLSAVDLFNGDTATLECWSLNITPYVCTDGGGQCPGSDLSLTMSASPNPGTVGSNLSFTMTVSNAGPGSATNVVISQSLPPGFAFVTTSNYPAQVSGSGTNLTLSIGNLLVYGTATLSVVTIPSFPGLATSVATVGSTEIDPNPNNNTASATALVTLPTADLAVSMNAAPTALLQGGQTTFTIIVRNNGPYTATGVVLTNELPANVNFVSATASQGNVSVGGLLAALGTIPAGSNAVVTITVSPTTTGDITDTAQVGLSPLETDPVSQNNTASFTVSVGPSADLGVSASVTPSTVVAGSDSTYVATVVNNGPSAATGVIFSQTIPGGTGLNSSTFVSSSQPGVTVTNGIITWSVGDLASGASAVITNVLQSATIPSGGKPAVLSSTFSVFGQPGDANTNNNFFTVQNQAETPTVSIVPVSAALVSQSGSPPNGAINPGDTVEVQLYLQNEGNVATTNLAATLQATGGVTLPSGNPQFYGAMAPGGSPVGGAFGFTANSTNGGTVVATLSLQDGSTSLGTVSFTFYMPVVQTFWNTNQIYIPALQFVPDPDEGAASPYPSSILVSNVTGYVSKVTATVSNLYHTYPNDIGILLVGPGTNAVLMDAAADHATEPATGVTITFDATASLALPSQGNLNSGTFAPGDYNPSDVFTNALAPPYSASLTNFNDLPPNGVWSLYAHDDASGDSGGVSNGWAVTITTVIPVNPINSLTAGIVASSAQVIQGGSITYLLSVTNTGATTVSAYLTNVLPAGLSFVSAGGAPGGYTQSGQTLIYNLGSLNPGTSLTISNVDLAVAIGLQTNTIIAGVPFAAFNLDNNAASVITGVSTPLADLAAGLSVTPSPAIVSNNVTYTLSVTNLGPSNAVATVGTFSLAGLQLVSVSPSQGSFVANSGSVQCSLGTVSPGNIAVVAVTAVPVGVGTLTNTWSVSTSSDDTNSANNSATALVTVTYAVPVIVANGATLQVQGTTPPNGAINSNETVTVSFALANIGSGATTNLSATLQAGSGITPITLSQVYGAIPVGGSVTEPYSFTAVGAPGATVTATLALADGTNSMGDVSFPFLIPVT
ncbi:MAG TPA: protease pro-enzyme activation domain-containing protein, partial [Verrucomicrobiae bacterium]|nr:protease pro-enzyme activation domain-containing protein [Verrucomicrobiae bacterium]